MSRKPRNRPRVITDADWNTFVQSTIPIEEDYSGRAAGKGQVQPLTKAESDAMARNALGLPPRKEK